MQGYPGSKATDQYLAQRLEGASPEQLAAILLEGGQKFLTLALAAMGSNDIPGKARCVNRVADFILELSLRLNHEDGGEVVDNLDRIYKWWQDELYVGARQNQPERLELIRKHMGELAVTWEELHRKKMPIRQPAVSTSAGVPASSLDLMVG